MRRRLHLQLLWEQICSPSPALQTSHKPASTSTASEILPPRTSGRKSKKPRILQPTENLRDHTVGYKNWAQTGKREFHKACVERDKSTDESMTAQKKLLIKMGILTMNEYIFDAKVQARLNEELPLFLNDLRPLEGSSKYIITGTDSYAILIGYLKASFISYEIEIARLNRIIRRLRAANKMLQSAPAISEGVYRASKGQSKTMAEFSERHLRRQTSAIIEAVKKEGHGCPVKEIFLAREVLRRLQPDAEDLHEIRKSVVHSAIVQSLQVFYASGCNMIQVLRIWLQPP